jgi:hypothetical protein
MTALAALLPLLVFAASTARWSQMRCLITGLVTDACCCGADGAEAPGPAQDTVAAGDCCDREVVELARPPSEAPVKAAHDAPPVDAVAAVAAVAEPAPPPSAAVATRARAPSRAPLPLLKHALLI